MKKACILSFLLLLTFALSSQQDKRLFVFGHSLIDHRPPAIATPSDETTVPHWLHLLATEAGNTAAIGGKYGFLPQHAAQLPPISQWGYDIVPGVWESDTEPFSAADISTILLTAGNFMQWQGPDQDYPGDPSVTPINATATVFEWVSQQESGVEYFIYENWPDMAPYLTNGMMPPTPTQFADYNNYVTGDFHDWWLEYQDSMLLRQPDLAVRMIPVGPVLVKLLTDPALGLEDIPLMELYEDDAPHGRANLYFLASLITYPAIFGEQPPANYTPPTIIHPDIRAVYTAINDTIWSELQAFNDDNGNSRVFPVGSLPVNLSVFTAEANQDRITLFWSTTAETATERFYVERRQETTDFEQIGSVAANGSPSNYEFDDLAPLPGSNTYRLRIEDEDGQLTYSALVTAELTGGTSVQIVRLSDQRLRLTGAPRGTSYRLLDSQGRLLQAGTLAQVNAAINLPRQLPLGVYFLLAQAPNGQRVSERFLLGD